MSEQSEQQFSGADLRAVVAEHVSDGDCVYVGNFGTQLFSVAHELIRQNRRDLHVVVGSGGLMLDQLIGAGVASAATFGHCWSPVGPAPAHNFRRLAQSGDSTVRFHELSLGMLSAALQAAAWGVPFMPVEVDPHSGYVTEDWTGGMLAAIDSPFGSTTVIRSLCPDIAFVHVDAVDPLGNATIVGPLGETVQAAQAAHRTVVVAEEVVGVGEKGNFSPAIAGIWVTDVVVMPGSAHPDGTMFGYPRDIEAYGQYVSDSATEAGFDRWLQAVRSAPWTPPTRVGWSQITRVRIGQRCDPRIGFGRAERDPVYPQSREAQLFSPPSVVVSLFVYLVVVPEPLHGSAELHVVDPIEHGPDASGRSFAYKFDFGQVSMVHG